MWWHPACIGLAWDCLVMSLTATKGRVVMWELSCFTASSHGCCVLCLCMKTAHGEYELSHILHLMLKCYVLLPSDKLMLTAGKLLEIFHLYHPSQSPTKLPHPLPTYEWWKCFSYITNSEKSQPLSCMFWALCRLSLLFVWLSTELFLRSGSVKPNRNKTYCCVWNNFPNLSWLSLTLMLLCGYGYWMFSLLEWVMLKCTHSKDLLREKTVCITAECKSQNRELFFLTKSIRFHQCYSR